MGVQEPPWDLGLLGRALGSRDVGSGSEKSSATHLFWNILKLDLKQLLLTKFLCLISDISPDTSQKEVLCSVR